MLQLEAVAIINTSKLIKETIDNMYLFVRSSGRLRKAITVEEYL